MRPLSLALRCHSRSVRRLPPRVICGEASRVDAALAQSFGEGLAPALQVGFARVEPLALLRRGLDAQVHVRVGLMVVQDHHIAVVGELDPGEFACRPLHGQRIGAARHRQHDVEGFAAWAHGVDLGAADAPLALDLVQRLLAAFDSAAVVFDVQAASSADVAQMCSDRRHAAAAAGDLDHDLWRTPHRRLDAAADLGGSGTRRV